MIKIQPLSISFYLVYKYIAEASSGKINSCGQSEAIFLPGYCMDRGAWQATDCGVAKGLDKT